MNAVFSPTAMEVLGLHAESCLESSLSLRLYIVDMTENICPFWNLFTALKIVRVLTNGNTRQLLCILGRNGLTGIHEEGKFLISIGSTK